MNEKNKVTNLKGHSGCFVDLISENNCLYVKKMSSNCAYNFRLKKQCLRQSKFKNTEYVKAPTIIKTGNVNGLFYFDMQYVQAKTLAEYTEYIETSEIKDFIVRLFKSLYIADEKFNSVAQNIFEKKIWTLENCLNEYSHLRTSFKLLKDYDWSKIPKTPCHGDLTLENILITEDNEMYLIDFLDSFYSSWMIDVAKLLQDIELYWSFRYDEISINRKLRLNFAKESLVNEILLLDNGEDKLVSIYHLLLLNIIRIFPYVKDNQTYNFLNASIIKLENKLMNRGIQYETDTNYTLCR